MRFAWLKTAALLLALAVGAGAQNKVNPHTGINWPAACASLNMVYSQFIDNCISATGIAANPAGGTKQVQYNLGGAFAASAAFTFDPAANTLSLGSGASDNDDAAILMHRAASNPLASVEPSGSHGARDEGVYDTAAYSISGCVITSNVATCQGTNAFATGQSIEIASMTTCSFLNYTITSPTTQSYTILSTGLSATQFEFNVTHANISCASDPGFAQGVGGYSSYDAAATCGSAGDKVPWNHCNNYQARLTNVSPQRLPSIDGYQSQITNNGGVVSSVTDFHATDVGGSNAAGIGVHYGFSCDIFSNTSSQSTCFQDFSTSNNFMAGSLQFVNSLFLNNPANGAGSAFGTGQFQSAAYVAKGVPVSFPTGYSAEIYDAGFNCQTGTGGATPSPCTFQSNGGASIFGGFVQHNPTAMAASTPAGSTLSYWNWWNGTIAQSTSIAADSTGNLVLTPQSGLSVKIPSVTLNGGAPVTANQGTGAYLQHSAGTLVNGNLVAADASGNTVNGPTPPAGAIVGTTDTQTLTNKTLDGVTPATMGFVDPTSSIQTQLNTKTTASSPTVGQAACIKAAGPPVVIGYCSTAVGAGGACTCN